ncbi:MAG: dihydrolipoyl dehydrogenase [Alistipes sp.]|nr:dihydrolipoyl dehydrogenase [Candidatus Minthomonas equi]
MEKFDILVLGSGPGGYVAAIRASQLGFRTAVVERAELGGVCLNWGCIPTKALLSSAEAFHYAGNGAEFGFDVQGNVTPDLAGMVARSRGVSAQMTKGVEFLIKKNNICLLRGNGFINPDKTVTVTPADGGEAVTVEADSIIIATGSHPNSLPFAPIDGKRIISYRQALVLEKLPESLAVIGSGAIGSEFAFFYRSLGVEVTLIEYLDRIVPLEDDDVSAQISRSFRKMGMKVMVSAQVKKVDVSGELVRVEVETKKGREIIDVETVLSAVGVAPNTQDIGLEGLGVEMERGKVKVDVSGGTYRANVEGIYAIGDVIATPALAHVASAEALCCVEHIAGIERPCVNYGNIPGCTYVVPQIASVGITERAAKECGLSYKVAKFPFTASGKAVACGVRDGFVKLISDAGTGELLGAHLCGANVTEMIGGIAAARNVGVKAADLKHTVFPHPTMSEAIMEASEALEGMAVHI